MASVHERISLSTTDWTLLYTVPSGAFAVLDFDIANLSGAQVTLQIAEQDGDTNPANVTNGDIRRSVSIPVGGDYNPHHLRFDAGYSIFAKTSTATVNVTVTGEDGA